MPDIAPPDSVFRWEDLDHQLINGKLRKLAEEMQAEIYDNEKLLESETIKKSNVAHFLPAFFEMQRKLTSEWARKIHDIYCEVWQLQGRTRTLDFVKAVYERAVLPVIAVRQDAAEAKARNRAVRIGSTHNPQLPAALAHWKQQIRTLTGSLLQDFESETLECKYVVAPLAKASDSEEAPIFKKIESGHDTQREQSTLPSTKTASDALLSNYRSGVKRAILIQLTRNPHATDLEICRGLDADGAAELPASWKGSPRDRLFVEAYLNSGGRRKVEVAISKIRTDLRKQGLLARR